ncbi:hypothetical protein [Sphaerisporangium aureirubrum]|uniref:hypothetical protein n=1 Tax=Sphaerisporangium aureirubrum TaxID=1544736 RepID=UPI00362B57EF
MSPVLLVTIVAIGAAAAGFPAARASHAAGSDDPRDHRIGVSVTRVDCPAGRAEVVMNAPRDRDAAEYSVHQDGKLIRNGLLWPGVERTIPVHVDPQDTDRVGVTIEGQGTTTYRLRSTCDSREDSYAEYQASSYRHEESSSDDSRDSATSTRGHHHNPLIRHGYRYNPLIRGSLPHTGPPTDFYAKVATALGLTISGSLLLWLALLWPHPPPRGLHPHMTLRPCTRRRPT